MVHRHLNGGEFRDSFDARLDIGRDANMHILCVTHGGYEQCGEQQLYLHESLLFL
jgi:hypothetical protein